MNKHEQPADTKAGDTWVDTSVSAVIRAAESPDDDEIVARTRTTPTRHDGTQRKRP